MELAVYNSKGKETKKINLDDAVFGIDPNDHAMYLDAKQHLANRRQGTHKSKERGEIKGSTRKLRKQKGSGAARVGSIKSPIFRGGGRILGPRPRTYGFKLNKKVKDLARKSALSYKVKGESLKVVEDFNFETARTKNYIEFLNNLKAADQRTLMVIGSDENKAVYLSSRNLQKAKVVSAADISTYDIMNAKTVFIAESAIESIQNQLK